MLQAAGLVTTGMIDNSLLKRSTFKNYVQIKAEKSIILPIRIPKRQAVQLQNTAPSFTGLCPQYQPLYNHHHSTSPGMTVRKRHNSTQPS